MEESYGELRSDGGVWWLVGGLEVSRENGEVGVWMDPLRDGRGETGGRTDRLLSCRIL